VQRTSSNHTIARVTALPLPDALRGRVGRSTALLLVILAVLAIGYVSAERPFGMAGLLGLVAALISPRWCLLGIAIASGHFLQGYQLPGGLIVSDLLLAVYVARVIASRLAGREAPFRWGWRGWLVAFVGWAWLSLIVTGSWVTATALARVTVYAVVFLLASQDRSLAKPLFRFVAAYATFEAVLALTGVIPPALGRLAGLYGDPGVFGLLMLAGIAGTFTLPRWLRAICLPLLILATFLTFSRNVWVAAIAMFAIVILPRIQRRFLLVVAIIGVICLVGYLAAAYVTSQFDLNPQSLPLRLRSWETAVGFIQDHPGFGLGWDLGGQFGHGTGVFPPYNLWLNVAASTGILGAVLLTIWLAFLVKTLAQASGILPRAGLLLTVAFLTNSIQAMSIYAAGTVAITFFILAAAAVAAAEKEMESPLQDDYRRGGHPNRRFTRGHGMQPALPR
jgi:hypothetical protein